MKIFNTTLILMVFLTSIISGCDIGSYTIVKKEGAGEGAGIADTVETKEAEETPKKSRQEILAENVKAQIDTSQKNTAPTILITEPDGGEVIAGNTFELWWKAEDPNNDKLLIKLEYQKDGAGKWILLSDNENNDRTFLWNLGALSDGGYKIRATVTDGVLSSFDTKSFTIKR